MADVFSSEIRQGFLCPICLNDLGDVNQLQSHFVQYHKENDLEGPLTSQLKGLFGRAKQRLLQFDGLRLGDDGEPTLLPAEAQVAAEQSIDPMDVSPYQLNYDQENGAATSHTKFFREVRDHQIDQIAVDTNKLIIRLDRLITECPQDPVKRKAFERELVAWHLDSDSPNCSSCMEKFALTRRKHHCRLCGAVMCQKCSVFLTFLIARKLVHPVGYVPDEASPLSSNNNNTKDVDNRLKTRSKSPGRILKGHADRLMTVAGNALKRDGSDVSLGSFFNPDTGDSHIRLCATCHRLLIRRDAVLEARQSPPIVVQMYERMASLIDQVSGVYPNYCRMADSLNRGESMYTLEDAKETRIKLGQLQHQVDQVSRAIATLGITNDDSAQSSSSNNPAQTSTNTASAREQLMQRNIRLHATAFIRDLIIFIPPVPEQEEYVKLQQKYKQSLKARINQERQDALSTQQHATSGKTDAGSSAHPATALSPGSKPKPPPQQQPPTKMSAPVSDGWTAQTMSSMSQFGNPFVDDMDEQQIDPLQQQIGLIKSYLRQAAQAGRTEEVAILEENLKELEFEWKQQQPETPRGVTPAPSDCES